MQRHADDAGMKGQGEPRGGAGPGDLLHHDGMGQEIGPAAPVSLRKGNPQPAAGAEFGE